MRDGWLGDDFRSDGIFLQFGIAFVRVCRLIDTAIIISLMFAVLTIGWTSTRPAAADILLCIAILEIVAAVAQISRSWRINRLRHELARLMVYWTISFAAILLSFHLLGDLPVEQASQWVPAAAAWYVSALTAVSLFHIVLRMALRYYRAFGYNQHNAAFIGATETTAKLLSVFDQHRWMGIRPFGIFDDRQADGRATALAGEKLRGDVDGLYLLARQGLVNRIYLTLPMAAEQRIKAIIDRFGDTTASIYYCPPLSSFGLLCGRWDDLFGQPVIGVIESPFEGYSRLVKRIEDMVLLALILPVILLPAILIAIIVKIDSPGPVFYRQTRYGLNGKPFLVWKFRSMYVASDDRFAQARRSDSRVTRVGAFLRRTSLDELPQLLNVLDGTMSVVGPRPHPVQLNEEYRTVIYRYMVRHKIKPGITGLAQVNGWRGETETLDKMEQRVALDLEYLRRWSLLLDLDILLRTLLVPFHGRNAY